jgi:hypothetical protein
MLSQAVMDQLGRHAVQMYGALMEPLTYRHRSAPNATPVVYPNVCARLKHFRAGEIDLEQILRNDLECRLQTCLVTWTPTRYDDFDREDGTTWQVLNIALGKGHPWYKLQVRQVG